MDSIRYLASARRWDRARGVRCVMSDMIAFRQPRDPFLTPRIIAFLVLFSAMFTVLLMALGG
jgi:hypothetical protein